MSGLQKRVKRVSSRKVLKYDLGGLHGGRQEEEEETSTMPSYWTGAQKKRDLKRANFLPSGQLERGAKQKTPEEGAPFRITTQNT